MITITEVKYYYYRDQHRAPRVTLCRVRDDLGRYGYGWSICTDPSPHPGDRIQNDTLIRGGRSIARGRAEAALSVRRGLACRIDSDRVICRLYWRPIRRREALVVIRACTGALRLLACLEERDVRWLPETMRPKSVADDHVPMKHILAGSDANELARLEMLGYADDAGYLDTPTVYSEALERFVPESETR